MAIRFLRVMHAKQIFRRQFSAPNQATTFVDVPKGHLAVYVGENQIKRYVVPISLLRKPSFQELLSKAEKELEYYHPMGGLTIPCREDIFLDLLQA